MQIVLELFFGDNPEDICSGHCDDCGCGEAGCQGHLLDEREVMSTWGSIRTHLPQHFPGDEIVFRYVDMRTVEESEIPPKVDQLLRIGYLYPYVLLNGKPLLVGSMDMTTVVKNIQKLKVMH